MILQLRLQPMLSDVISPEQGAFNASYEDYWETQW